MFVNGPAACPKELFHPLFTDRSFSQTKNNGDWLDSELVQRCEELVQRRFTSKELCHKRKRTLVSTTSCIEREPIKQRTSSSVVELS